MAHLACLKNKNADCKHIPFFVYVGKVRQRSLGTLFKRNVLNAKKNEIPSSLFSQSKKDLNVCFILKFSMLNVFHHLYCLHGSVIYHCRRLIINELGSHSFQLLHFCHGDFLLFIVLVYRTHFLHK